MAPVIHLDTHVLVWLYVPRLDLLSARARGLVEEQDLKASPAALLELEFLHEIGRLRVGAEAVVQSLHAQLGLALADEAFGAVAQAALLHPWTRDPFDRLIVGQAEAAGAELLTRDETIRAHFSRSVW